MRGGSRAASFRFRVLFFEGGSDAHRWNARLPFAFVLAAFLFAGAPLSAQERPGDKGETPEQTKLRDRDAAHASSDIDDAVTFDALLAKKDKSALSESKGATIEGWVVQVEREEDGDIHLALAPEKGGSDTKKW